jgi:hypothetical protein
VPEPKALAPHLVIVATSEQAGEAEADDRLHDRVLCRKHRRRGNRWSSASQRWEPVDRHRRHAWRHSQAPPRCWVRCLTRTPTKAESLVAVDVSLADSPATVVASSVVVMDPVVGIFAGLCPSSVLRGLHKFVTHARWNNYFLSPPITKQTKQRLLPQGGEERAPPLSSCWAKFFLNFHMHTLEFVSSLKT